MSNRVDRNIWEVVGIPCSVIASATRTTDGLRIPEKEEEITRKELPSVLQAPVADKDSNTPVSAGTFNGSDQLFNVLMKEGRNACNCLLRCRNGPGEEKATITGPMGTRSLFDIIKGSFSPPSEDEIHNNSGAADVMVTTGNVVEREAGDPQKIVSGPSERDSGAEFDKIVPKDTSSEWPRCQKQFPFTERLKRLSQESRQKGYQIRKPGGNSAEVILSRPSLDNTRGEKIAVVTNSTDIAVNGPTHPAAVKVPAVLLTSKSCSASVFQRNGQSLDLIDSPKHQTQFSVVNECRGHLESNQVTTFSCSNVKTDVPRISIHSAAEHAFPLSSVMNLLPPVSRGLQQFSAEPRSQAGTFIFSAPTGTARRSLFDCSRCDRIVDPPKLLEQKSTPEPTVIPSHRISISCRTDHQEIDFSQEHRMPSRNCVYPETASQPSVPARNEMTCSLRDNRSLNELCVVESNNVSASVEHAAEVSSGTSDITQCSSCEFRMESKRNGNSNTTAMVRRLKSKLPSPSRDVNVGDLYRDASQLTREERALQRAMMRFSEMEMREKRLAVDGEVKQAGRKLRNHCKKKMEGARKHSGASTWLKTFKRKRLWISSNTPGQDVSTRLRGTRGAERNALSCKKHLDKCEDLPQGYSNDGSQVMHPLREKKVRFCMKKEKAPPTELEHRKRRLSGDREMSLVKGSKRTRSNPSPALPQQWENDGTSASARAEGSRSRSVKTYLLVASSPGFKDFKPVVLESRTRKKTKPSDKCEEDEQASPVKPPRELQFPLLVVESVKSKPVKEMVIAESAHIKQMVENCLRAHGKWRNLVSEEEFVKDMQDPESGKEETKKLAVNRTTGETILHKAARLGYHDTVHSYITHGADPGARDNAGWTPLHESCTRGKLDVAKVLTRFGADANACSNDGIRPVHDAAEGGHVEVLRLLLSYGADPTLVTYSGNTALDCAKDVRTRQFLAGFLRDVDLMDSLRHNTLRSWEFPGSCSVMDDQVSPDHMSGILDTLPESANVCDGELELSDRPHLPSYNLPVFIDDVVVSRRNYVLLQDVLDRLGVTRPALSKKMKNLDVRQMRWSDFVSKIRSEETYGLPKSLPAHCSTKEETAELLPITYNLRRMLGIRVESVSIV